MSGAKERVAEVTANESSILSAPLRTGIDPPTHLDAPRKDKIVVEVERMAQFRRTVIDIARLRYEVVLLLGEGVVPPGGWWVEVTVRRRRVA